MDGGVGSGVVGVVGDGVLPDIVVDGDGVLGETGDPGGVSLGVP